MITINEEKLTMNFADDDNFYMDVSRDNIVSDVNRVGGVLLRKDGNDTFRRILTPSNIFDDPIWSFDGKKLMEIVELNHFPDETAMLISLHSFDETKYKKSWNDFIDNVQKINLVIDDMANLTNSSSYNTSYYIENTNNEKLIESLQSIKNVIMNGCIWARSNNLQYNDKLNIVYKGILFALDTSLGKSSVKLFETGLSLFVKLCKCGEDLIIPSMIEKCLNTFVPLLRENYVSLTLKTYILQQIIICMIEPQVVEKLLGWNDPNDLKNNTHALYQKHILSFLLISKKMPYQIIHLLNTIICKVAVYQCCKETRMMANKEKIQLLSSQKSENQKPSDSNNVNNNVKDEQHQQKEIDNLIQRLIESLRIITNRALYHTVISSPSSSNDNDVDDNKIAEYSSFSFRYLTFNELFPSITILLTSPRLNKSLKFKKFVNYVALLCTILLGEDIDDTVSDSLPQAFNDDYRLFKMTEIRNTLGIGDLWCGPGQFTKDKNDDNDCHYVFDYNDKELLDTKTKEDHNMKKAKEILKMQSYGAIGTNSDCLDNLVIPQNHLIIMLTYHTQAFLIVVRILEYGKGLVSGMQSLDETNCKIIMELFEELIKMTAFNVGNQAVASSIINLDALPTILSFVNINPSSVATDYDFGRIPLELLEIVVKFSRAVPFLLSSQTNELVLSLISNDNHLRSLWDPIATFHETANIQGIIDIIKHQKYYPECLRDHTVVNQLLISLRFLLAYTYTDGGINQILVARMDDFSGLDNGDSLLVFLLRLLNSASEILYDLSDFFVYTENNSLNDPNFSNFSNFKEEIENQDELKNTDTTNIKRLLKVIYGNRESSAAKQHFKNVYEQEEILNDPIPSQKKTMIQTHVRSFLALVSALDHLDGNLSNQINAISLSGNEKQFKFGQSAQLSRIRDLVVNLLKILTEVVVVQKKDQECDSLVVVKAKYFSEYVQHHVIKQLIEFVFEGPENFLTGLYLIKETLPKPTKTLFIDSDDENDEEVLIREYWTKQLVPLRDEFIQLVKSLIPASSKLIHSIIRKITAQIVCIDIHDFGLARGIIAIIINGVRESSLKHISLNEKMENLKVATNPNPDPDPHISSNNFNVNVNGNAINNSDEMNDENITIIISEIELNQEILGRWLSLMTYLCKYPSGKSLLFNSFYGKVDDVMLVEDQNDDASNTATTITNNTTSQRLLLDILQIGSSSSKNNNYNYDSLGIINKFLKIPYYDIVNDDDDSEFKDIIDELFNTTQSTEIDFELFSKEILPNFQYHKKLKMSSDDASKNRKLLKTRTLSKLGGVAYESNARRNLGGGKTYQKNEFRSIHNNRKANTSRPPSVHVDDFMSGKIPVNQQHPEMLVTATNSTATPINLTNTNSQQKKTNLVNRSPIQNKRGGGSSGGIIAISPTPQIVVNNIPRGRTRRPSTSSVTTPRGAPHGSGNLGRGTGGVGRGGIHMNAGIVRWDMGNGTWMGGLPPPPSIPLMMGPPMSKQIEFERHLENQHEFARYDNQNLRARTDNRGRGIQPQQEWQMRSLNSQPARQPDRPF
ncbi:1264_t:CDS:10, partial [Entrophospora sp. SA101]